MGYPVGTVFSVKHNPDDQFESIMVTPAAQLNNTSHVLLVWPTKNDRPLDNSLTQSVEEPVNHLNISSTTTICEINTMSKYPRIVIPISFVLALILGLLPMPAWFENARPEWVALVLIFWVIAMPQRINVGIAWMLGLLLDGFNDTLLGEHPFSTCCSCFCCR